MADIDAPRGTPFAHGNERRVLTDGTASLKDAVQTLRWLWRLDGPPQGILCVGTDRSTGDALGPLVGTELQTKVPRLKVWGTLDRPVHAANLADVLRSNPDLSQTRVMAVDASLGKLEDVGTLLIGPGPLHPGSGVNKQLPPLGRYHMTGTVNVGGFMEYFVLQNTRLALVMHMASFIALALADSLGP
ncbi:MAG: spore protease YyaC [Sulfobacillus sp.]